MGVAILEIVLENGKAFAFFSVKRTRRCKQAATAELVHSLYDLNISTLWPHAARFGRVFQGDYER